MTMMNELSEFTTQFPTLMAALSFIRITNSNSPALSEYMACSAGKCDNLVVETDIFAILGVSFCVTWNALNFNEIKTNK